MKHITLDIETSLTFEDAFARTGNKHLNMAVLASMPFIAVTSEATDGLKYFSNQQVLELVEYLGGNITVGWNIAEFDLVILGIAAWKAGWLWRPLKHLDLFDECRKRSRTPQTPSGVWYALDEVAKLNLGQGKLEQSSQIPSLFFGEPQRVFEHCQQDVLLEQQLFGLATTSGLMLPDKMDAKGVFTPSWTLKL
jgi:hypothetical protein